MKKTKRARKPRAMKPSFISKRETAMWVRCVSEDKRVPKDVREMCADIALRLESP